MQRKESHQREEDLTTSLPNLHAHVWKDCLDTNQPNQQDSVSACHDCDSTSSFNYQTLGRPRYVASRESRKAFGTPSGNQLL